MTEQILPHPAAPSGSTLIATKRDAVQALRKAQGALERGSWQPAATLIQEALKLTLICTGLDGSVQ